MAHVSAAADRGQHRGGFGRVDVILKFLSRCVFHRDDFDTLKHYSSWCDDVHIHTTTDAHRGIRAYTSSDVRLRALCQTYHNASEKGSHIEVLTIKYRKRRLRWPRSKWDNGSLQGTQRYRWARIRR